MVGTESDGAGSILLLEQDENLRDEIRAFLLRHGFQVLMAADIEAGETVLRAQPVDLVVLGAQHGAANTPEFCRRLTARNRSRVLVVGLQVEEFEIVLNLEAGADDCLVRPFSHRELLARIRAILRRQTGFREEARTPIYVFDVFVLDVARRELRTGSGKAIALPMAVMELLQVFVDHPKRLLSRDELIATAGLPASMDKRAIDMRVSRLRQTLRAAGGRDLIRSVRGTGYVLDGEVALWDGADPPP
jgi:two-component system OmpR family response regulator